MRRLANSFTRTPGRRDMIAGARPARQNAARGDPSMDADRDRRLRLALRVFGVAFLLVYPLMILWPSGWAWQPRQHEYELMMVGIYATLGVFLLRAARQPGAHASLIWFTVWSSVVHGGIMAVQALVDPAEHGHLPGDVAALFLVALVLGVLGPRGSAARSGVDAT
jgi:hypothetical protein